MRKLTPKQIYALYLINECHLTHEKAAKIIKVSRSAITKRIKRAKKALNA